MVGLGLLLGCAVAAWVRDGGRESTWGTTSVTTAAVRSHGECAAAARIMATPNIKRS
jgi:hypothetical protein